MCLRKQGTLILLFSLLLALITVPVQAAVIPVDPGQPVVITSRADAEKVARLQNVIFSQAISPVSPDDQSLLIVQVKWTGAAQLAFLNINDSSTLPVKFPGPVLPPIVNPVWAGPQTVIYLAAVNQAPVLVTIDRASGNAKVDRVGLPGYPLSFSPDASRLLFLIPTEALAAQAGGFVQNPLQSPFDLKFRIAPDQAPAPNDWHRYLSPEMQAELAPFVKSSSMVEASSQSLTVAAIDLRANKIIPVFTLPPQTILSGANWSPDGSRLALTRFYELENFGQYSGGQSLGDLLVQNALGNLPPDKNPLLLHNGVDIFDFNTNTLHANFLQASAGDGDIFWEMVWSPDNQVLMARMQRPMRLAGRANPIYLLHESGYLRFYGLDGQLLNTFDTPEINAPDINISAITTFVAPNEIVYNIVQGTNLRIYYYNRASGEFRQLPIPDGAAYPFVATHQSRQIVFGFSSFVQAPELYRINLDGSSLTQLTALNTELTNFSKVRVDPVSFTLANGQQRSGYLLQDGSATGLPQNAPLIVWQEGGPIGPFLNTWDAIVERPYNLLPNFGFTVLFVPLPGRIGFGPAFFKGLYDNDNYGRQDIDEMSEIVRQVVERGYTTPGKIGITGCSYGGYFTTQSLVRHGELYAAANSQCTPVDMLTETQLDQTMAFAAMTGRVPATDPDFFIRISPLFNSGKIKTPTLLFHGTNDFIPIITVQNFHDRLQLNGVAVNLMTFNREGHGLAYPTHQLIAGQAMVSWFRQYLGVGAPAPAAETQP